MPLRPPRSTIEHMFDKRVGRAIQHVISEMPNFFSLTRTCTMGSGSDTETTVYTQDQIAAFIGQTLPRKLPAEGAAVIALAPIIEEHGLRSVRVPLQCQPNADGEVHLSPNGDQLAIVSVPARMPVDDAPALASALMAAYVARHRD